MLDFFQIELAPPGLMLGICFMADAVVNVHNKTDIFTKVLVSCFFLYLSNIWITQWHNKYIDNVRIEFEQRIEALEARLKND